MSFLAKVIAHSKHYLTGKEICTMQLSYPRFIHAEFMTHRVFSRNASSSRAIPVAKMIEQVRTNPAMPIHWGKNQPGMQAAMEHDAPVVLDQVIEFDNPSDSPLFTTEPASLSVQEAWCLAAEQAALIAEAMAKAGYHKQVVNRILEPFQWIHVIVTATEWDNFFALRDHEDAQPEIRHLAQLMKQAMSESQPKTLSIGDWHLPYVTLDDVQRLMNSYQENWLELAKQVSAARCCRVSYLKHDGTQASLKEELELCEKLASAVPIHASPFEHQATPDHFWRPNGYCNPAQSRNFVGWMQYRSDVEYQLKAASE